MKHLKIHKFPFKNVIVAIECKMYLKISKQTMRSVVKKTRLHEFREGRFLDEKLPFLYKKKAEHSFELSLSIFCLLTVYFNLEMQNSCLKTSAW